MPKEITKVTLIAENGVLKNLIQKISNNKDLMKFEKKFLANMIETKILITKKKEIDIRKSDWDFLLNYIKLNTENLIFQQIIE